MSDVTMQFVPEWTKGMIWYQIFPERFWNESRLIDQVMQAFLERKQDKK